MHSMFALLVATCLLMVPLLASLMVDGWLWTGSDYVFAWIVFATVSLAFTYVAHKGNSVKYKVAAGVGLLGAFLLFWVSAAVGVIGDDNPGNLLYCCT
jgi:hypothetical protein